MVEGEEGKKSDLFQYFFRPFFKVWLKTIKTPLRFGMSYDNLRDVKKLGAFVAFRVKVLSKKSYTSLISKCLYLSYWSNTDSQKFIVDINDTQLWWSNISCVRLE